MPVNLVNVATINRVPLYRGQPGTSVATVYTVPASTDVKVASIVLANTTAVSATVTLHAVPSGGSAGVANQVVPAIAVPGNSVTVIESSVYMAAGDFIAALQGTVSAVTVTISGETYA